MAPSHQKGPDLKRFMVRFRLVRVVSYRADGRLLFGLCQNQYTNTFMTNESSSSSSCRKLEFSTVDAFVWHIYIGLEYPN